MSQIVETTENFIQILDSCTKHEEGQVPFYHQKRGGIRVEDLINRFKSESKFDTMSKGKKDGQKKTRNGPTHSIEHEHESNDLYSLQNTMNEDDIQIVKMPSYEKRG